MAKYAKNRRKTKECQECKDFLDMAATWIWYCFVVVCVSGLAVAINEVRKLISSQLKSTAQTELDWKFYSEQLGIAATWIRLGAAAVRIGALTIAVILMTIVNVQNLYNLYKRAELQRQRRV